MPGFFLTAFVFFSSPAGAFGSASSGGGLLSLSKPSFPLGKAGPLKQESRDTEEEKKWSLSWNSSLTRGVHYLTKNRWSNSLAFSYGFSKISAGVEGAYVHPLSRVTNTSYYGLTDISLSLSRRLEQLTGRNISAGLGISLPTSKRAVRRGKRSSFYGLAFHKSEWKAFQLTFRQVVYWGWYGSRSDKSGFSSNPLLSSSSGVSAVFVYKDLHFSVAARLYLYMYSADMNRDPSVEQIKHRLDGNQGGSFQVLYNVAENWNFHFRMALNIPVVSPVLTGVFPLVRDRNLSWSLGTGLKL